MDLNRLMRPLVCAAAIAIVTGCSSTGGSDVSGASDDLPGSAEQTTAAPFEGVAEPLELDLQAPSDFSVLDAEREVPMSEAVNTYAFAPEEGSDTALLMVSTYVLESEVDASDYQAVVNFIREYNERVGHDYTAENDRRTLVHGRAGVGMLIGYETSDTKIVQQNHYLFEGSHSIQITCQWTNSDFSVVYQGCKDLLTGFQFPEGWPA